VFDVHYVLDHWSWVRFVSPSLHNHRTANCLHVRRSYECDRQLKLPVACVCFNSAIPSTRHTLCWQLWAVLYLRMLLRLWTLSAVHASQVMNCPACSAKYLLLSIRRHKVYAIWHTVCLDVLQAESSACCGVKGMQVFSNEMLSMTCVCNRSAIASRRTHCQWQCQAVFTF
jgi:hypothetical protein